MKCKRLSTTTLLLLTTLYAAFAQTPCSTVSPTPAKLEKYRQWILQRKTLTTKSATGIQYIPIRFHVVRQSDGTGGVNLAVLNQTLITLNKHFGNIGISFYMSGATPDFINNSAYYAFDAANEDALCAANEVRNAINVYITNTISVAGAYVGGYAYAPDAWYVTNRIFVTAGGLSTGVTLIHELGHYFNLYHTFERAYGTAELVTRGTGANCSVAGDLICDTPADPYGQAGATFVSSNCTYTGTIRDANGELYAPMMTNFMSYYSGCVNQFTAGQYARMQDGLLLRNDPTNEYNFSGAPQPVTLPDNVVLQNIPVGITVQFTYAATDAAGFLIERATSAAGPFSTVGALAPLSAVSGTYSFTDTSVNPNATYYYRIKPSNAQTTYSSVQSITTGVVYCVPPYSAPVDVNAYARIDDFSVAGTTLQTVATGLPVSRFSEFTSTAHQVVAGQTYTFTCNTVTGGGSGLPFYLAIWLDLDRNGVFTDNERLFANAQTSTGTVTGTITIPTTAQPGQYRMRIRSRSIAESMVLSACDTYKWGETEDYQVTIPAPLQVRVKAFMEGFLNLQTGLMTTELLANGILPKQQPFNTAPWNYAGTEQVSAFPANVSDWIMVYARTTTGTILARKAAFIRNDGILIDLDGSEGIRFTGLSGDVYISIHQKSHLAVMTNTPVSSGVLIDFTTAATVARGNQQEKLVGTKYVFYVGDYDGSGIINAADFNKWSANRAAVGMYLSIDADGNTIVNAADFNRWVSNRSMIGITEIWP